MSCSSCDELASLLNVFMTEHLFDAAMHNVLVVESVCIKLFSSGSLCTLLFSAVGKLCFRKAVLVEVTGSDASSMHLMCHQVHNQNQNYFL